MSCPKSAYSIHDLVVELVKHGFKFLGGDLLIVSKDLPPQLRTESNFTGQHYSHTISKSFKLNFYSTSTSVEQYEVELEISQ